MTSPYLLLWIVGGILLQLTIYLGIRFGRHWTSYQTLRLGISSGELPVKPHSAPLEIENAKLTWPGLRDLKVSHKVFEDATQQICSFHLVPQDGQALAPFLPGQYLTFRLDVPTLAGDRAPLIRCYSLSDAPHANGYRVSIKRAPAPANSPHASASASHFFHDQVQVGTLLQVRAPAGHFHLDHGDAPVVLIGGGIGITPLLSMLKGCVASQPAREIWLFYGVRNSSELMAQPQLEALAAQHPNFHLNFCFSDPLATDTAGVNFQHRGRIDVALLRRLLPLKPYHLYICGPTPMLESLVPALQDWGVPDARIHFEAFGPASIQRKKLAVPSASAEPSQPADAGVTVSFAKAGVQLPWQADSGSLLDLAESHGMAVNSGCRAGGCGSCQTTILSGEVSYLQSPDFDPEPGTCLLCVCTPKTNVTLEL